MWFQVVLHDSVMMVWKQWKYPLTLSLFFVLIYLFCGVLDPNPSVTLPDDIRLILADRRRMQLADINSRDVSVVAEHNIRTVIASELLYAAENTNDINSKYGKRKQELNSNDREPGQKHDRLKILLAPVRNRVSDNAGNNTDSDRSKIDRWLHHREIIGNERFVNRFQNGIQKPEDFYERNKDVVVKIRSKQNTAPSVKMQSTSEIHINTSSSNRSRNATGSLLHFTNRTDTDRYQKPKIYRNVLNVTSSRRETKPSNLSTDLRYIVRKIPDNQVQYERVNVSHKVNSKTESTFTSVPLVKAIRSNEHIHSPNAVGHTDSSGSASKRRVRNRSRLNGTTLADLEASPYPPLIVRATGAAFLDRVRAYNAAIASAGAEILKQRGYGPWRDVADSARLNVVWGNTDDFLERVSEQAAIRTVLLAWSDDDLPGSAWSSLEDRSNVLVKKYFAWSATPPLCAWIQTPGFTKARWDAVYDRECSEDMSLAARPRSLEFMYFYAKPINVNHYWPNYGTAYPTYFYTRPPPHVFYVYLLQDAVVNVVGDVISGGVKLVPYTCSHDNLPTVPAEYPDRPVYRELFVMTQFWGQSFFHKIVEVDTGSCSCSCGL